MVLFHDLTGNGWQLVAEVTGTSFLLVHSTLNHNAKIIRRVLKGWALQWITPGTSQNWTAAARQSAFPKCIADATLLMDSFDLPTQKVAKTRGPKSPYWSAKLKKPGWRFMIVIDAKCKVRYISAGYSPKVYDGHWVQARRDWLESTFENGAFLADGHFHEGEALDNVKFYVPSRTKPTPPEAAEDPEMEKLVKKEEARNKAIKSSRSRAELAISRIKQPWKVLQAPWAEELNQLTYLVYIAVAVYNRSL